MHATSRRLVSPLYGVNENLGQGAASRRTLQPMFVNDTARDGMISFGDARAGELLKGV